MFAFSYMTARQIHMFCAYWGLVVMSLQLGFHWNIAVAMAGQVWEHPSEHGQQDLSQPQLQVMVYMHFTGDR